MVFESIHGDLSLDNFGRLIISGDYSLEGLSCSPESDVVCSPGVFASGPTSSDCGGCLVPVCGNGSLEAEQCDDGNLMDGDGCSSGCTLEACGNGPVDFGEACDDGNLDNGDGCSDACTIE